MDLTSFGVGRIEAFMLVLVRTAGIFTLVPIFGSAQVPVYIRVGISVAIALVFVPFAAPAAGVLAVDLLPMVFLIVKEALVGITIGFVTTMVFAAIQAAGDFIDTQAGFSFAATLDPIFGAQTAVAGRLHQMLAGLLFFVTNAHHILLAGLADSFRVIPITQTSINPAVAGGALDLFAVFFTVALRIAAPVLAAVFLADVALAIVARVVPQMNVLMVGLPLKLGVGLVGMLVALPVAVALTRGALGDIGVQTTGIVRVLGAH